MDLLLENKEPLVCVCVGNAADRKSAPVKDKLDSLRQTRLRKWSGLWLQHYCLDAARWVVYLASFCQAEMKEKSSLSPTEAGVMLNDLNNSGIKLHTSVPTGDGR